MEVTFAKEYSATLKDLLHYFGSISHLQRCDTFVE